MSKMTKGTLAFRVIICVLLALVALWSAFIGLGFIAYARVMVLSDNYGVWVAGVEVTRENKNDILGDGTVSYNASANALIFENSTIETNGSVIESNRDLRIWLAGQNKFICSGGDYLPAIYASNSNINMDLSFEGDGSLELVISDVTSYAQGIIGDDITIQTDITVTTPNCQVVSNGIVCTSSLILYEGASVTVNNGAAEYSSAVRVIGNAIIDDRATLGITSAGGSEICKGLSVNGDLILEAESRLDVSVDDESCDVGECVRVTGLLELGKDSVLNASAKETSAVECYGSIKLNKGASLSGVNESDAADVLCYGAFVDHGAAVSGDVEVLGGANAKD